MKTFVPSIPFIAIPFNLIPFNSIWFFHFVLCQAVALEVVGKTGRTWSDRLLVSTVGSWQSSADEMHWLRTSWSCAWAIKKAAKPKTIGHWILLSVFNAFITFCNVFKMFLTVYFFVSDSFGLQGSFVVIFAPTPQLMQLQDWVSSHKKLIETSQKPLISIYVIFMLTRPISFL